MKAAVIGGTGGQGIGIVLRFRAGGEGMITRSRIADRAEAVVVQMTR